MIKTSLLSLKVVVTGLLFLVSANAMAELPRCLDVFPTVLSSSRDDGKAALNWKVALSGTVEGNLDIGVDQGDKSPPGCDSYRCKDSGNRSKSLDLPTFKESNSGGEISVERNQTRDFFLGNYGKITLVHGATAHFKRNNSVTKIKELSATNGDTKFIFDDGVYWIETFNISSNTQIIITDDAKVTLIIKNSNFEKFPTFFNTNGTPDQLVLIAYDDIQFGSKASFKGFIYADKSVGLKNESNFEGAINGSPITLGSMAAVAYALDSIESANFNGFCSIDDATLKNPIFSPSDGISGGQLKGQSNGEKFHIGKIGKGNNKWPIDEGPEHLIDGVGQKYLNFGRENTGAIITPAIGCSVVDSIKFWTANDNEPRDPASYKLYGTNTSISDTTNPLSSFTLLTEGPLALPSSRNSGGNSGLLDANSQTISFTNSSSYSSYLLYFPTVKTERSANSMQLAEIQVFGTARSCAVPVLEYRFDEVSWDGTSNEVIDSSPNNNNGTAKNHLTTLDSAPAITGPLGTCSYGEFDGVNDYVAMGNPASLNFSGEITLAAWIRPDSSSGLRNIISHGHRRSPNQEIIFRINGGNYQVGSWNGTGHITSSTIPAGDVGSGNWVHLAGTYDGATWRLYRNGVEISATADSTGALLVSDNWAIGARGTGSERFFDGGIDEPRIYSEALNATQISALMNEKRTCPTTSIHHYEIQHDGHGLTCEPESITVKACTNETCTTLSAGETSLDVTATGTNLSVTDNIKFTGTGTASIRYTLPESTLLSLSKEGTNSTRCSDGSATSCDLVFANAGFRFLSGNSTTIPNQKSGTVFGETLKIQAVKDTKGVCTGLFSGTKNINLSQENVDPGGTKGLRFSVDGDNIAKHSSVTSTALSFSSNSIAVIPKPLYNDAGKIRLHANYTVGQGEFSGVNLSGSSEPFWVSPDRLTVIAKSGSINLDGNAATAITTHKAGEDFDLIVSAYNANNVITPNYSPGQIQLKLERTGPTLTGSADGDFSYASASTLQSSINPDFKDVNLTNFVAGVSTYDKATYSEVGLLNLGVRDRNYGGENIMVEAAAIAIGRFKPDYFKQTVTEHGKLFATCGANSPFAYSGQMDAADGAISYLTKPVLKITAHNAQGKPTKNYISGFAKLAFMTSDNDNEISFNVPVTDLSNGLVLTGNLPSLGSIVDLGDGVLTYTLSQDDNFVYTRDENSEVAPFQADFELSFKKFKDSDGVTFKATDVLSGEEYFETPKFNSAGDNTVEIRFGRLVLQNSFGPETVNLTQQLQVEYYNGNNFVISSDDNCLGYEASNMILTNISLDPALTAKLGGTDGFIGGETQDVQLQAPGAGNTGDIGVEYDTDDWLTYDWITAGAYINPTAVASFGFFRGNDRVIYKRRLN